MAVVVKNSGASPALFVSFAQDMSPSHQLTGIDRDRVREIARRAVSAGAGVFPSRPTANTDTASTTCSTAWLFRPQEHETLSGLISALSVAYRAPFPDNEIRESADFFWVSRDTGTATSTALDLLDIEAGTVTPWVQRIGASVMT